MPLRKKITLSIVNTILPNTTVWDTDLKGFCVRRQKSEAVSYLLKTRVAGQIRWFTLGRHGNPWTPETARKRVLAILNDPTIADAPPPATATVYFSTVADEFLATYATTKKPRTQRDYRTLNRGYLLPTFGSMPIRAITRADVAAAHRIWSVHPRRANYALALLSVIMNWAEDNQYRDPQTNPCRRQKKNTENKRQRYLTTDELARLGAALTKAENEHLAGLHALSALWLLIFTGARLGELLTLQWSFIDLERRMIFLPDSKTGQKPIILNEPAMAVLKGIPRFANNPYVIVGNKHGTHLSSVQRPWTTIRQLAGLLDVRIHDLRHTFASVAVAQGGTLPVIGRALGHSNQNTTSRYAHLADDQVRQLTQVTGQRIAEAMTTKPRE